MLYITQVIQLIAASCGLLINDLHTHTYLHILTAWTSTTFVMGEIGLFSGRGLIFGIKNRSEKNNSRC